MTLTADLHIAHGLFLAQPLALLLLLPIAALAFLLLRRQGPDATWATSQGPLIAHAPASLRARLQPLPEILRVAGLVALCIALARPQTDQPELREVEGIDLMIALDLSGSMYAVDMSANLIQHYQRTHGQDPPNRIKIARDVLREFVERRERDRIGLVVFAREAWVQFPLTLDYGTVLQMIDQIEIGMIDASATAIGNAIGLSLRGLLDSPAETRAIILITDGKQHGGNIDPRDAARLAAEEGIRVFSILIGDDGPTMMPSVQPRPGRVTPFRPEVHPIDPELLDDISSATDGAWYSGTSEEELRNDLETILATLERSRMEDIARSSRREHFAPFLFLGLFLLVLELLLAWRLLRRYP